jgi:hypothetical protein
MILDEIKDLIKQLETILVKDNRFKEYINFKNQLKIIYNCKNNPNKEIYIPNSIDITPLVISNLTAINKPKIQDKSIKSSSNDLLINTCEIAITQFEKSLNDLSLAINEVEKTGVTIKTKTDAIEEYINKLKLLKLLK